MLEFTPITEFDVITDDIGSIVFYLQQWDLLKKKDPKSYWEQMESQTPILKELTETLVCLVQDLIKLEERKAA